MMLNSIHSYIAFFSNLFSLGQIEKPTKFFHIDRKLRSAIYFMTGKINRNHKLHKVLVIFDEKRSFEKEPKLIVILSGPPKRILLNVESQINEVVKTTAEMHNLKMSVWTIFQSEYENPAIYPLPSLIIRIREEGIEVCNFNA